MEEPAAKAIEVAAAARELSRKPLYLQALTVDPSLFAACQRLVGHRFAKHYNRVTLFKVLAGERSRATDSALASRPIMHLPASTQRQQVRRHSRSVALLIALLAGPAAIAAPPAEAPLHISSQAPLQSLRLGLLPVVPAQLPRGETLVQMSGTWTNVWVNDAPSLLLDYEALDSRITLIHGLTERTELQLEVENRKGFGGFLDPLIQDFHGMIGNGMNGRDSVGRNQVHIEIRDPETGKLLLDRHALGSYSRGIVASVAHSRPLASGQLAYAGSVRVPLRHGGDEVWQSADAGVSLAWSRVVRGRSIHLGGALTRFRKSDLTPITLDRTQKTGFVALVQPVTPRTALIVQYLFNDGAASRGPLSRSAHELTFGGRIHLNEATSLDIGILENIIHFDNGPDFGFHVAITRRTR